MEYGNGRGRPWRRDLGPRRIFQDEAYDIEDATEDAPGGMDGSLDTSDSTDSGYSRRVPVSSRSARKHGAPGSHAEASWPH